MSKLAEEGDLSTQLARTAGVNASKTSPATTAGTKSVQDRCKELVTRLVLGSMDEMHVLRLLRRDLSCFWNVAAKPKLSRFGWVSHGWRTTLALCAASLENWDCAGGYLVLEHFLLTSPRGHNRFLRFKRMYFEGSKKPEVSCRARFIARSTSRITSCVTSPCFVAVRKLWCSLRAPQMLPAAASAAASLACCERRAWTSNRSTS